MDFLPNLFSSLNRLTFLQKKRTCRRILTEHHGYRIAVIMNEFGDTAVSCLPSPLPLTISFRVH